MLAKLNIFISKWIRKFKTLKKSWSFIKNHQLETKLTLKKSNQLKLKLWNRVKNIPLVLPSFLIKIWGKSVKGFMFYDRAHKQNDRQKEITNYMSL